MFFERKLTKLGSLAQLSALALCLTLLLTETQSASAQRLPVKRLTAGMHVITAEIAATDAARTKGLMFRDSLEPNHGMVFVFEQANVQCFWMKNTKIALSIAFIKANGVITNIAEMAPMTETSHCSTEPVLYTLEMEEGWFAKHGVSAGKSIGGL
jgi:uncharacterized membrane protein (UPF0127 family)